MLLAVDIGNSNVTLGIFNNDELIFTSRIATDVRRMPDEYGLMIGQVFQLKGVNPEDIREICMCSVVPPLTSVIDQACKDYFSLDPFIVEPGVKTGIKLDVDNPKEVGTDRVADAVALLRLYGCPAILVDFGTATVFDAISREGAYIGGAIALGIAQSAEALFTNTAQLRKVELVAPKNSIGRNTVTNIQSGLVFGYTELVEGMVKRFREELGNDAVVVGTGGLVSLIDSQSEVFDHVNPDITLIGLRLIKEINGKDC